MPITQAIIIIFLKMIWISSTPAQGLFPTAEMGQAPEPLVESKLN